MSQTKCKKCGYEWNYKGKLLQVTCPNCGYKTPRKKLES